MVEGYYTPDSEFAYLDVHVKPQVRYTSKVNDSLTYHVALGYEAFSYLYEKADEDTASTKTYDNEVELTVGFKFK